MFCNNCGAIVPDNTNFCPKCGAPMGPRPMQQQVAMGPGPGQQQVPQQPPIPPAEPAKKKNPLLPVVIALSVVLVAAIVVAVGFATNWFGLGGQTPSADSPESASSASVESTSSSSADTIQQSSSSASASSSSGYAQSSSSSSLSPSSSLSSPGISSSAASSANGTVGPAASSKRLVVGFDPDYPPYGYMGNDGSYTGFDLDLAQEVCRRNGWSFEPTPINWDSKERLMESGSINCIWSAFASTPDREKIYTFSDPYLKDEIEGEVEQYAVAFKLGDTETARIVSDTLREMYADGTVSKIAAKYADDMGEASWILK